VVTTETAVEVRRIASLNRLGSNWDISGFLRDGCGTRCRSLAHDDNPFPCRARRRPVRPLASNLRATGSVHADGRPDMPSTNALAVVAFLLAGAAAAGQANAQAWPSKLVRFLVCFAPGGSVDLTARILSGPISEAIGTQVLVESRPGASGNIAGEAAAKAAPDGYTMMMSSGGPLAANRAVIANMSFDPQRDFYGIALAAFRANIVVVNPRVPAKNMADLIRNAKSAPNKLS
jgi:hypothetical protein